MSEPLFGSVSPLWSAMPSPALGYMPAPSPFVPRPVGQGVGGPVGVPAVGPLTGDPYANTVAGSGNALAGIAASLGIPAFAGTEIGVGITAPTLLAAVAVRRGQPLGPTNDQEIEDFIYDALDLLPGANDVEVRCDGGRTTVTGTVPHKRLKRDVGEVAWAIPNVIDVQNNITIAQRRRSRGQGRENEPQSVAAARKQA